MIARRGAGRPDFEVIAGWIPQGAHVLDLGCGDGALLRFLRERRGITGYGVEIDDDNVLACTRNGVAVIQSDLERGLSDFDDRSFDFVLLSQTLQAMRNTERIVREMLRVGRAGIVAFPNFGYWKNRLHVLRGRMPVSPNLPYSWFNTPNIHLCTLSDFEAFCAERGIRITARSVLTGEQPVGLLPNLLGEIAIYRFSGG
jgi:methionine biosynthesis protein MetW